MLSLRPSFRHSALLAGSPSNTQQLLSTMPFARRPAPFSVWGRQGCCMRTSATVHVEVPLTELLEVATQAAESGAEVVRAALDKPRQITFKGATDLVTETDKASEEAVLKVVRSAYPGHAVLGEEGGVSGDTSSAYLWAVDPLDGTTNFTHNYPAFAVSVAVLRAGVPVAGCIVEFAGGPQAWVTRTFTAYQGGGAFCNGKPVRVSEVSDVTRSLLITGFGYLHDEPWLANIELFRELTDVSQGVRRLGAAAVDLGHVALGIAEAYWEYRLKPWDVAAGVLLVQEAGGRVTTMDGRPYTVFERSMVASNGHLHDQLLERMRPRTQALVDAGIDMSPYFIPEGYKAGGGSGQ